MEIVRYILFLLILMFGVFMQALAGFGGTLISMPLGIMIMGIGMTKPVLTIVAWLTGIVVFITDFKYINWRELLKMVAVMLLGVLAGMWVSGKLEFKLLMIVYALIVLGIGAKKFFFPKKKTPHPAIQNTALAIAGIMQGLYVSGGSFLAVYSVEKLPEKREFRATVNSVWAIVDTVMVATFFLDGTMTPEVLTMSGVSIVPALIAIWLGGLLTKKVNQNTFLKMIYIILMISGAVLLITNL